MTLPFNISNMAGVDYSLIFTPTTTSQLYGTSGTPNPPFAVGTLSDGSDGSKWVYVKYGTGGVTGIGYSVVFDEAFLAVMMSNSVGGLGDKIGIPTAAASSGDYGWVQVYGVCASIRVSASAAANVALASTTTAGELDDSVANPTKNITGIWLTTANGGSAGLAPGELNWPTVGSTN